MHIMSGLGTFALYAVTLIAGAMAFGVTLYAGRRFQNSKTGLDLPDEDRKSHSVPISRLGGVAISLPFFIVAGIFVGLVNIDPGIQIADTFNMSAIALAATIAAFLIGLWDDLGDPPTLLKLGLLVLVFGVASAFGLQANLTSPFGAFTLPAVAIIGSALWLIVFTNAANFMDGSNGIMAGSLAIMFLGLGVILDLGPQNWLMFNAIFGAIGGFLVHNLRGKLFAGDAGSLGLGALFSSFALASGAEVWTIATLALPFLIDVLMTLVWRAKHGRPWLKPHRDHAYQRLIDYAGWSHVDVALLYWGLSIVCAFGAVTASKAGGDLPFGLFWVLLVAGIGLWCANRIRVRAQISE